MGELSNIDKGAVVGETLPIVGGERKNMGEIGRIMFSGAESDEAMLGGPTSNANNGGGTDGIDKELGRAEAECDESDQGVERSA
ncbi:serine/threonine-protein kinase BLUS1-like [Pyrus ussuriensis x Pyrus communis]|uniref:Serine/threonine-protein kinase BLUS1-like n=1 Tax=Pyrus ussuriensis x Pyrus communis TaxID=2448454 RepID=A0A5N5F9N4_9ROSA|nr:serine/threonine-protein kinase BLUS1-like [Pyrus ussuriensis x Pyrus communis]